jgi:hypothetical protein
VHDQEKTGGILLSKLRYHNQLGNYYIYFSKKKERNIRGSSFKNITPELKLDTKTKKLYNSYVELQVARFASH